MGPRPDGRGKAKIRSACRARISVNGAAARRPRKAGRSPCARRACATRQWGRGQTAAERRRRRSRARPSGRRQWGRGQTAAESRRPCRKEKEVIGVNGAAARRPRKGAPNTFTTKVDQLRQWGRGQTAAESSQFLSTAFFSSESVNGAAARRPRKVGPPAAAAARPSCVNGAAARRPRKAGY